MLKFKRARSQTELSNEAREKFNKKESEKIEQYVKQASEKLAARDLLIEQWDLDDIQADLIWCGRNGSPTKVHRIQSVVLTGTEHKSIEPTGEAITELVHELIEDHTIG